MLRIADAATRGWGDAANKMFRVSLRRLTLLALFTLSEEISHRFARFQILGDFGRLGSRIEQRLHRGHVISRLPVPTVFGTVERRA